MTRAPNLNAEAALSLLSQLRPATQHQIRRRLTIRLAPPESRRQRREHELGLVADLLRSAAPRPGWSFAYVARKQYDLVRGSGSPSSASLVGRYGSWVEVCRLAHNLTAVRDGSARCLAPSPVRSGRSQKRYSLEDAAVALRECARELQRTPSRSAYSYWLAGAKRRYHSTGAYPCANVIKRLYAERGGWLAALEDAGLVAPPRATVRIVATTSDEAVALVAAARTRGLIAAHAGMRKWLEIRGTLAEVRPEIADSARALGLAKLSLWEPHAMRFETLDLVAPWQPD